MFLVAALATTGALMRPLPAAHVRAPPVRMSAKPPFGDPLGLDSAAAPANALLPRVDGAALAIGLAALAAAQPEEALAKGGEYGIFEGRIVSLAHPTVMALMYAASAWAAFTGLQWRRLREIGSQITELKAKQKGYALSAESVAEGAQPSAEYTRLGSEIDALTATRKELASDDLRSKHYQVGSVILGLGTSFAIEGPVNTFLRAQKLFPGPHLYAGAGVVVCWAMAASLVPLMSKGSDGARNAHIAFNVLALGLFTWQLPTGWEIALKVIEKTKFP